MRFENTVFYNVYYVVRLRRKWRCPYPAVTRQQRGNNIMATPSLRSRPTRGNGYFPVRRVGFNRSNKRYVSAPFSVSNPYSVLCSGRVSGVELLCHRITERAAYIRIETSDERFSYGLVVFRTNRSEIFENDREKPKRPRL